MCIQAIGLGVSLEVADPCLEVGKGQETLDMVDDHHRELQPVLGAKVDALRTEDLVDVGTRLELCIHIDESGKDIRVRAEVVSHNVGPSFGSDEHGMGMRFLDLDEATRKQIEKLYERSLHELVASKDG